MELLTINFEILRYKIIKIKFLLLFKYQNYFRYKNLFLIIELIL